MTATTKPPRLVPSQTAIVTRLLVAQAMRVLLIATVISAGALLLLYALGRRFGWQFVQVSRDDVALGVVVDQESVAIVGAASMVYVAVGLCAVVVMVVLTATRTRLLISVGITRRAITLGTACTTAAMMIYALVITAIVVAVVGPSAAFELLGANTSDALLVVATGTSSLLLAIVAGAAATVLFLRWPWWVGVLILVTGYLALWVTGGSGLLDASSPIQVPLGRLAVAGLLALAYWAMMRRLPVR